MQEEAGSVEEPLEQTSDKTEPTVQEEEKKPAEKKSSKKKKNSVPTVDEVVAKETEAEEPVKKSEASEAEGQDSSVEVPAEEAESEEATKVIVDDDNLDMEERAALEQKYAELNLDTETALVETVLFLESEPQTVENLAKITRLAQDVVEECIGRLKEKYTQLDSGI